ncbi:MerR family transcriptional regulator [Paenibacillus sp. MMS20-IR301]|uniref:MerR family transcriptional regulator n=1 Tax=Paenibacillus sp. MMS20-IR301 TaxID=2895946 RepID=UPI0028EC2F2F|nr:MerR family transcriptional regulator [Paenibacillus sp. MMS20-IR301]WNS42602.1 MerR family transcriptional regulator [Paenibacillus sp. MMS20-IR301]
MRTIVYSIKQVVEMLDIPSVTLRAWENRYQAVVPERTESGYRLYSQENIEDLRWLKEQTEKQGISISHAVRMLKLQRQKQLEERLTAAGGDSRDAIDKMKQQIYTALYEIQGERADALIDFGFSLYGYEAMVHQVLVPVLIRVGDAWEAGTATVAQEHYMTHMVSNRLSQFFHVFPVYAHLPKVLAFCPAGEHHQVGLLLFSLFLRKNGVEVIYLGANTPEEGVLNMLEKQSRIGAVCLSVTDSGLVPYCEGLFERLSRSYPEMKFIAGGKGYETAEPEVTKATYRMSGAPEQWQAWYDQEFAGMRQGM